MKTLPLLFSAILVITVSAYAGVSDYYIYPAGTKPTGIPPVSSTVTNIELAGWADAAVDGNAPSTAFGADEAAHAEDSYAGRQDADLLVKFSDAYSLIAGPVVDATLHLYLFGAANASPSIGLNAARILSSWSEGTVTWNTKPTFGSQSSGYSGTPGLNGRIGIDVTAAAQAEQAAAPANRHGIGLYDTSAVSPYFFAKESPIAAYRPYLHVMVPEPDLWFLFMLVPVFMRSVFSH